MYSDAPVFIGSRQWANDDDIDFVMGHNSTFLFNDVEGHKCFSKLHQDKDPHIVTFHMQNSQILFHCKCKNETFKQWNKSLQTQCVTIHIINQRNKLNCVPFNATSNSTEWHQSKSAQRCTVYKLYEHSSYNLGDPQL